MKYNFPKMPLLISIVLFIFSLFVFFSLYTKIKNNTIESDKMFSEWKIEDNKREGIKLLDRSMKNMEDDIKLLDTHFAKSSDVVPFLDTIESLATKTGSSAEVLSVNIPIDSDILEVGIRVDGSFSSLYKFITLLENSPYEIKFDAIDLVQTSIDSSGVKKSYGWSTNLNIKLLSFIK